MKIDKKFMLDVFIALNTFLAFGLLATIDFWGIDTAFTLFFYLVGINTVFTVIGCIVFSIWERLLDWFAIILGQ